MTVAPGIESVLKSQRRVHYCRDTVWAGGSFKSLSVFLSKWRLAGSTASSFCCADGSFSVSVVLTGWLSCSFWNSPASSPSFTLCTMKRCLLRDNSDVKHRPQWRHWGVFTSVLCWGICCWNCAMSSVTKPHFEQRNCVFRRLAEHASGGPEGSGSWEPAAGVCDTRPCE